MGRQSQVRESLPKGAIAAGFQRCSLSESRSVGARPRSLASRNARPTALLHTLWRTCGRREEEAGSGRPGEILVQVRARDGGRHPGLQEAVALRGAAVKRSPRPVRLVRSGSPPLRAVAPATVGCPLDAEEGNVVGVRETRRTHPVRSAPPASRIGDTSFTRSRDPRTVVYATLSVRRRLTRKGAPSESGDTSRPLSERSRSPRKRLSRAGAERARFEVGQTGFPGGTDHGTGSSGCCAARRVSASVVFGSRKA